MDHEPQFHRTWRVTWLRGGVMAAVFGIAIGFSGLWSPGVPEFGYGLLLWLAAFVGGFLAGVAFVAIWFLACGIWLDHKLAYKRRGWAILVHVVGLTVTYLVVVLIAAYGPLPDAIWMVFFVPIVVVLGVVAAMAAWAVPGSFPDKRHALPVAVDTTPDAPGPGPESNADRL